MNEDATVALIRALSDIWRAIRSRHPAVPAAVVIAAPSLDRRMRVLGHFAPLRWRVRDDDMTLIHEVMITAEFLDRPAADTLETLIHEACHAANFAAKIHDCSRNQYHNRAFRDRAYEMGLIATKVRHYGWALTELAEGTAAHYYVETQRLASVLIHRRRPTREPTSGVRDAGTSTPSAGRLRKATCGCPLIIRASRKVLTATTIRCDVCGQAFGFV